MGKSCIHIYCGDGKGKSTAVMGLALRAAGSGKKVVLTQFLKNGKSSELNILRELPQVRINVNTADALVPLASMFGYATDLRSSTQGRGQYSMEPHSYVEIPKSIAEKIIAERGRKEG